MLPDARTQHNGSLYSSSATTGDFESYVAHDVVTYTDDHYRTIPLEIYSGTHTSEVADRLQNHVLPFFSQKVLLQGGVLTSAQIRAAQALEPEKRTSPNDSALAQIAVTRYA